MHVLILDGDMQTAPARRCGLIHTDLLGGVGIAPALGNMYDGLWPGQTRKGLQWRPGEMGTTFAGDTNSPGFGEMEITFFIGDMYSGLVRSDTRPVRSCGIMETAITGDVPVTLARDFGEIPISPVRFCGDIYATGAVGQTGDTQTVSVIGDIHAGVWAGDMAAGLSATFGYMETT
jgi:hypothetical protein